MGSNFNKLCLFLQIVQRRRGTAKYVPNPDYNPHILGLDPVNVEDFIDPSPHDNRVRSAKFVQPQINRRSGSSLDYIFALQESAEFEPTKGSRKRATYLYDQDSKGSDTQTKRIYRGTNKYDPFSTQTSLTRRTSSTEVGTDLTSKETSSRGEKQIPPPNANIRNSLRRRQGTSAKNVESRIESRSSSKEEQVKPSSRRQYSRSNLKEQVSSTAVPSTQRTYTRARTQGSNEKRLATTRKSFSNYRKNKENKNEENLEDENYPEAFKALIKSRNKNNSEDKKPVHPSTKPKFPTRSRQTRERTSTTTTPATSLSNNSKDQKYTRNGNKKVLFPTRKSSPRTSSTTVSNNYDNENLIEPTQPPPDFNYQIKFSEPEDPHTLHPSIQNTLKSPFLTKIKASSYDSFTMGPGQKQMSAPFDVTVSFL